MAERLMGEWRVFGPPGTGKTTTLSRYVRDAVEKHGSDGVIVASFTRTAAAEIAGRDLPVDPERVGTLHAHCYRALGKPTIAETKVKDFNAEYPQYALSSEGHDLDEPATERQYQTAGDELMARYQVLRARMICRDLWPPLVVGFARCWEEWVERNDYIDFTGMIERALERLDTAPGNPRVGFFDEMQDSSALELALVRKWGRRMSFFVVCGDDDQAIYEWRGSSPEAFLDPPVPEEQKRVLRQSYRVPRAVLQVASAWIQGVQRREPKEYAARDCDGEVRDVEATYRYPEPIVEDALRQIGDGRTVMVLASCGYMLHPLIAVLRREGIPFHNPYRRNRGDWNPLRGHRGTSMVDRLLAFLRPHVDYFGDERREWAADDVRMWAEVLRAEGVFKYGRKVIVEKLKGTRVLEYEELLDHFKDEAHMPILGMELDWYRDHMIGDKRRTMEFPLAVLRRHGVAGLTERPKLCVGTVHSVKGGEADVVYLCPDLSQAGMQEWMMPGEGRDGIRRQMYVGMTRAREQLVLCQPVSPCNVGRMVA